MQTGTPALPPTAPTAAFGVALLLTYGYEIFNFNLTYDEPLYPGSGQRAMAAAFAGQGRWGMALQYAVLPENILPTVTAGLSVVLIGLSLWIMSNSLLDSSLQVTMVASVAATIPALGFAVSFATVAVGFGLAFACVTAYAHFSSQPRRWRTTAAAVVAAAFAIGIYQAFAFALLAVVLVAIARSSRWATVGRHALLLVGSLVTHLVMSWVTKTVLRVGEDTFVEGVMDLPGLLSDPWGRSQSAAERGWGMLVPGGLLFDNLQPWLVILVAGFVILAVRSSLRLGAGAPRTLSLLSVAGILLIPFVAALFVPELPLRSMVYVPFCLVALAGIALGGQQQPADDGAPTVVPWPALILCTLAVIGNASATNRAYVASDAALTYDTFVAMRINEELGRLFPGTEEPVPTLVSSPEVLERSSVGKAQEQFGLTLFAGVGWRATGFLASQGVNVAYVDEQQYASSLPVLDAMPSYPEPGWVQEKDGVLLVKLGDDPEM